jgi:hypothetical protein
VELSERDESVRRTAAGERCPLARAADRAEICPGADCPFWEVDRQPDGGCVLERLGIHLDENPELVTWLLWIRASLSGAPAGDADEEARRLHLLEPPGLRD